MESTDNRVEHHIDKAKPGSIFFPEDFGDYGSKGAILTALHRMVKKKTLRRIAHGIYNKPQISQLVGEVLPTTEQVARAIARRDRARILPTGAYAQYALGLSTQIPLKVVFLTDGPPRKIKAGMRT
jgi:Family of unknown function (DUF6088)